MYGYFCLMINEKSLRNNEIIKIFHMLKKIINILRRNEVEIQS